MRSDLKQELEVGAGYVVGPVPSAAEVAWLRDFVAAKWRGVLSAKYPSLEDVVRATDITAYHMIAPRIDHPATWSKDARLFNKDQVNELKDRLSAFAFLADAFGPFDIADIEGLGYPEVYWRLVRPRHPEDVAGAHADSWFYDVTNRVPPDEQKRLIKVWLPVFSEIGVSGLAFAAGSQRLGLSYGGEMRHGRMKPRMTDPRGDALKLEAVPLHPGQCVAFHIDTVHRGISHDTDQCRVSIEFAIRLRSNGLA